MSFSGAILPAREFLKIPWRIVAQFILRSIIIIRDGFKVKLATTALIFLKQYRYRKSM
jgi:hypothetical protein